MWTHNNGSVYNILPARGHSNTFIENLTQVHRMNFILKCNVMAFRGVKVEVEACPATIIIGACVHIIIDIVDDVPCFPGTFSTVHVL